VKTTRREFVKAAGAGALGAIVAPSLLRGQAPAVSTGRSYDVAVIGAGVFGAWTANRLAQAGRRVAILDAYGPGNARSSSGGQTRVIRMGYGDQEVYTRWSLRSMELWKSVLAQAGRPALFQQAGVLWMARGEDPLTTKTLATLERLKVRHERVNRPELEKRWPQIDFGPVSPGRSTSLTAASSPRSTPSGDRPVAMAKRRDIPRSPSLLRQEGKLDSVSTRSGRRPCERGRSFSRCGPWLPKVFPDLLGDRIFPTRQEVFYFGPPPGDSRFTSPAMPVWVDFAEEIYGLPDFEGRGFKVAPDRHGPAFDPDSGQRVITPETLKTVREFVGRRFPVLKDAPLVAGEVCQYENTSNGDFLIDRHPERENVWLVGGGSGHGFKHGPAVGEHVAARILEGGKAEPRFSLSTKEKVQKRSVY
jgi:glycine/D-amino acid oxidase-like deaminating enzyme